MHRLFDNFPRSLRRFDQNRRPERASRAEGRVSRTEKGVNQNQMFLTATCSKQTVGARNKCQFFAIRFSVRDNGEDAGLPSPEPTATHTTRKYPAPHSNLRLQQIPRRLNCGLARDDHPDRMVILPTGHAVDYDAARSADRLRYARLGGIARHGGHLTVCGSSPSTDRKMDGLRGSQKQIPRRPNYGLARDDNETGHNGILNLGRSSFTELKEERDGHSHPGSTAR